MIDVSMTDNVYSMLSMPLARYSMTGETFSAGRDWLTGSTPCYNVYRTSDGHISVGALEPKFWIALCKALRIQHLIPQQFPDSDAQTEQVKAQLQAVLSTKNNQEWAEFFKNKDCCVEIGQHNTSSQ